VEIDLGQRQVWKPWKTATTRKVQVQALKGDVLEVDESRGGIVLIGMNVGSVRALIHYSKPRRIFGFVLSTYK
jgi:hypothetical protein